MSWVGSLWPVCSSWVKQNVFSEVGISKGVVDILLAHALNREARLTVLKEKGRYHVVDLIVDGEVL